MHKMPVVLSSSESQVMFESDCACSIATSDMPVDNPKPVAGRLYKINEEFCSRKILPDFSLYYSQTATSGLVVLNTVAESLLQRFSEPTDINTAANMPLGDRQEIDLAVSNLIKNRLLVDIFDESVNKSTNPINLESEELTVWLHITNQCNLRCEYCFVDKTIHKMNQDTAEKSIDAIYRSVLGSEFKSVKIKYAGGEPTLNFSALQYIHEYAITKFSGTGIKIRETILTNATYLDAEKVDYLWKNSVDVMVSLDGIGVHNDVQRHTVNGKGSFRDVETGLKLLTARKIRPTVSITITSKNCLAIPELTRWLLAEGFPFTFNFYRENQYSVDNRELALDDADIIKSLFLAYDEIENNPPAYSILGMLSDRAHLDRAHSHTCGVGNSYLVIDHNGQISKCHMMLHQPVTSIHTENPLQVIRHDMNSLQNPSVESKLECSNCEWRYVCTGGCPALTYRLTGRFDLKSPNCNIYKSIFPRIQEIEAIRLLKRNSLIV